MTAPSPPIFVGLVLHPNDPNGWLIPVTTVGSLLWREHGLFTHVNVLFLGDLGTCLIIGINSQAYHAHPPLQKIMSCFQKMECVSDYSTYKPHKHHKRIINPHLSDPPNIPQPQPSLVRANTLCTAQLHRGAPNFSRSAPRCDIKRLASLCASSQPLR